MSKYDQADFEARKAAMLEEIRAVMDDVEELYNNGRERGEEEIAELKESLGGKLDAAKRKLRRFEEEAGKRIKRRAKEADKAVHEKPYYAMGFAALAGLVVGVLLNRR